MLRASISLLVLAFVQTGLLIFELTKAVKVPNLASWRYAKLDMPELEKKVLVTLIVESVLIFPMAILFRQGFGVVVPAPIVHILMNTMLCVLAHMAVFVFSSALYVYKVETSRMSTAPRKTASSLSSKMPTTSPVLDMNQATVDTVGSAFLITLALTVTVVVVYTRKFVYQSIWFSGLGVATLIATSCTMFLRMKVGQSIAHTSKDVACAAANSTESVRVQRAKQLQARLDAGIISLGNVFVIYSVLAVLTATCSECTLEEVWDKDGIQVSRVPEISVFLVSTCVIVMILSQTLALVQNEALRFAEQQSNPNAIVVQGKLDSAARAEQADSLK